MIGRSILGHMVEPFALAVVVAQEARRADVERWRDALSKAGAEFDVFDQVTPDAPLPQIEQGIARFNDGDCDAIVAFGGGSAMDAAKAIAAQQNRLVDKMKRKGVTAQTAEQKAAESAEFLADCTVEFKRLEYKGLVGRDLAIGVYSDTTIGFISDQVAKHLGDWSNFTKGAMQD